MKNAATKMQNSKKPPHIGNKRKQMGKAISLLPLEKDIATLNFTIAKNP